MSYDAAARPALHVQQGCPTLTRTPLQVGRNGVAPKQTAVNTQQPLHATSIDYIILPALLKQQGVPCYHLRCCAHALLGSWLSSTAPSSIPICPCASPQHTGGLRIRQVHFMSIFPAPLPPSPCVQAPSNVLNLNAHSRGEAPMAHSNSTQVCTTLLAKLASQLVTHTHSRQPGIKAHAGRLHGEPSRCLLGGPLQRHGPQHGERHGPAHAQPCDPQGA